MTGGIKLKKDRKFLKSNWDVLEFDSSDQAHKIPVPPMEKPYTVQNGKVIKLLKPESWRNIGRISLKDAIIQRRSRRKYTNEIISFEELSFLLYATQGVKKNSERHSFRTVPSGGARHPFETYLFVHKVEGIEKGLYRYLPLEHAVCLEKKYKRGMEKELDSATLGQFWKAGVYFIWTAVPYRTEWRYIDASAKLIALDAGHLCQNLYLACEEIGCGTCGIGAYSQKEADSFLSVDGKDEFCVYMAPVGKV
ncbi:MAG TPA: SagB/ThcOx family dehydrogenase [Clostridiales bacterium]|nr:SagB/ThcOx family dehydrogenase [Clostridiales bacterium]